MNRRMAIFGAAALGLGALPAHAQLALDWVDIPPEGDALTKRLEDEAVRMLKMDKNDGPRLTTHPQTISFDYFYPGDVDEYRALGGNGLVQVSVVVHDFKALPVKRVVLRSAFKDVELQPVAARRSTVSPTSPLAKSIGVSREDAFFLLPGNLPGKTADLWVFFQIAGTAADAGSLSLELPDNMRAVAKKVPPGQPDAATLKKVLAREYPNLIRR